MKMEDRIDQGIAYLNEKHPGWQKKIDLKLLDLEGCTKCILGQIFGDYWKASKEVDYQRTGIGLQNASLFSDWASERGFSLTEEELDDVDDIDQENKKWKKLTRIWKKKINAGTRTNDQ